MSLFKPCYHRLFWDLFPQKRFSSWKLASVAQNQEQRDWWEMNHWIGCGRYAQVQVTKEHVRANLSPTLKQRLQNPADARGTSGAHETWKISLSIRINTCNPRTQWAEAVRSLWIQDQFALHRVPGQPAQHSETQTQKRKLLASLKSRREPRHMHFRLIYINFIIYL